MSEEPPQNANPGGDGDQPKKRRRRRRRNKNKSPQGDSPNNPQPQASDTNDSSPETPRDAAPETQRPRDQAQSNNRPPKTGNGYRGKNQKPNSGPRSGGPKRDAPGKRDQSAGSKSSGGPRTSGGNAGGGGKAPDRPGTAANTAAKPKVKKRRKPRTKQCVHCYTPCTTIHRVRVDFRKQWVFVCDICWPTRCVDNPHYEFGGTWVSGRIVKPESQLRDEWLAKQQQKSSNQKPREERPRDHDKPAAKTDDADGAVPITDAPPQSQPANAEVKQHAEPVPVLPKTTEEMPQSESDTAKPIDPSHSDQHAAADPPTEESQGS